MNRKRKQIRITAFRDNPKRRRGEVHVQTVGESDCDCPICAVLGEQEFDENGVAVTAVSPQQQSKLAEAWAQVMADSYSRIMNDPWWKAAREARELGLEGDALREHYQRVRSQIEDRASLLN